MLTWPRPSEAGPEQAAWDALEKTRFDLKVSACYCSLLDECWQAKLDGSVPAPVKVCDATGHRSFNDYAALTQELRAKSAAAPQ